jgi:hypothetical protein
MPVSPVKGFAKAAVRSLISPAPQVAIVNSLVAALAARA